MSEDQSIWDPVVDLMKDAAPVSFGSMHTYHCRHSPRRLLHMLSYYKFAAKLIGSEARVLDIGCGEGLGSWILAKECGYAHGLDLDQELIETARRNWSDDTIRFSCANFLEGLTDQYSAVVNFDVIEHIRPDHAAAFIDGMADCLSDHGIAVVGTPNETTRKYASKVTNIGHVNMYTAERLEAEMKQRFTQVFMFGANDEVVHTGFAPMCHYLLAIGVSPRPRGGSSSKDPSD